MKYKIFRVVAVYLALSILFNIVSPTVALALTGGPSQPEVESFEPVGTNQMVDLFSGDFNYNIPLMTVPGPGGGYPINMAYHAGIGMEQEASWVGLGWNINPGVVNRNLRGLPDDANGDTYVKQVNMKPNNTFAMGITTPQKDMKFLGMKYGSFSYELYYNNYKGVGNIIGLNLSSTDQNASSPGFASTLSLTYDSNGGLGVNVGFSYTKVHNEGESKYHLGVGYHSREGLDNITLSKERKKREPNKREHETDPQTYHLVSNKGAGVSYSSSSYVPHVQFSHHGFNAHLSFQVGNATPPLCKLPAKSMVYGSVSLLIPDNDAFGFPAYGYMYSQNAEDKSNAMMDFNREKDVEPTKNVPAMAIPIYTNDVFYVKGQGIGGVFRPYRSDAGVLKDPTISYDIPGATLGFETQSTNPDNHLGVAIGENFSSSYAGVWKGNDDISGAYNAQGNDPSIDSPLYEPVYFKASGEENMAVSTALMDEDPSRFDMQLQFSGVSLKPRVLNSLRNPSGGTLAASSSQTKREVREKRTQGLEYLTNGQIVSLGGYPNSGMKMYSSNNYGSFPGFATATNYDYTNPLCASHIGLISTVNPDGNRYNYGIPAYNYLQREVSFSVAGVSPYTTQQNQVTYSGNDNSINNNEGFSNFFESVETPPYAHSYLLTSVTSPDYVDLTNDGPSTDDLGSYTKFNYTVPSSYNWRIPYGIHSQEANLNRGNISDLNDDQGSYTYGTKDLYYLHSIQTKTHIAFFILNDPAADPRMDARGAVDENNSSPAATTAPKQRYLKQIVLYGWDDFQANGTNATPIKTVNFEYDYSLCPGVDNNNGANVTGNILKGKLTLKKVWFSYLGNTKGQLSPYQFNYNYANNNVNPPHNPYVDNPAYAKSQADRWGNYKPEDVADGWLNVDNPYVDPRKANKANLDICAGAWSLKSITLPSGGVINITYETDDYAYVQDQKAMNMCRIVGTGPDDAQFGNLSVGHNTLSTAIDDSHLWVYFELPDSLRTSLTNAQLTSLYTDGINQLYFKVFEKLKRYFPATSPGPDFAYDYVEGYCEIDRDAGNYFTASAVGSYWKWACVKVKKVPIYSVSAPPYTHPFRKAGWQYLKMQRPDLFKDNTDLGSQMLSIDPLFQVINIIADAFQTITGFYAYCCVMNYCSDIVRDSNTPKSGMYYKPSFLRLNDGDNVKYGGGHRVSKITITDSWQSMTGEGDFTYGQTYSYTLPDGSSSGVAEYEPLIGGNEIPLHLPDKYSTDYFFFQDHALYLTKPYGESYFPGASVGYSRVVVQNIGAPPADGTVTKSAEGISVSEFYTARDFPVLTDNTDLVTATYRLPVLIPFLGLQSFNNRGYSEGYKIELNNMHGKPKAVSTYAYNTDITDPSKLPINKVEYIYKTTAPYNPNGSNKLDNTVTVLDGDANYYSAQVGKSEEFFVDMREHSNTTLSFDIEPSLDQAGDLFTLGAALNVNYMEAIFRAAVTNKIICRNGILVEKRAFDNGSWVYTDNLMFDAETGTPLLTSVTNNFNQPVYTYKYAAQWNYDNMGGAYKNYGAKYLLNFSSGGASYPHPAQVFTVGDELYIPGVGSGVSNHWWVTAVVDNPATTVGNYINVENESGGTALTGAGLTAYNIRSGRRNMQSILNGTIVSLTNPVTSRNSSFFTALSAMFLGNTSFPAGVKYTDCSASSGDSFANITLDGANGKLNITHGSIETGCTAYIQFPNPISASDINGHTLTKVGKNVYVKSGSTITMTGTWVDNSNCFPECLDGVLHADATRYNDNWAMNYKDAGDPQVQYLGNPAISLGTAVASPQNLYRLGARGLWRKESNYAFLIDRKQSTPKTDISQDGIYQNFILHNWQATQAQNGPQWTLTSRISQYNPFGLELENKDTMNIYSSALYAYSNNLPTTVTANSRYMEMAFDGFEDYGSITNYNDPTKTYPKHMAFVSGNSSYPLALATEGHTGKASILVQPGGPAQFQANVTGTYSQNVTSFTAMAGKDYFFSVWCKLPSNPGLSAGNAKVDIKDGSGVTLATYSTSNSDIIVEGWHKIDLKFTAPASGTVNFYLSSTDPTNPVEFDDVRIQPFLSSMKNFVYDPITLWQMAELDDRNFATFYNYDEEGSLVQVKKETAKGVMTIKSSRNNLQH